MDNIDHAIAIARKYRHSIRMVTLEGESLSPGGSMTGGAFKNNSNLLGRRREIEELEKKVKELAARYNEIRQSMEDNRSKRNEMRDTVNSLQREIPGTVHRAEYSQDEHRATGEKKQKKSGRVMQGSSGNRKKSAVRQEKCRQITLRSHRNWKLPKGRGRAGNLHRNPPEKNWKTGKKMRHKPWKLWKRSVWTHPHPSRKKAS